MLGYFSVEWVFLTVLGLAGGRFLGGRIASLGLPLAVWVAAIVSSVAFYGLLRLAGKTPVGVIYESHPAARGHPKLSVLAAVCFLLVVSYRIVVG